MEFNSAFKGLIIGIRTEYTELDKTFCVDILASVTTHESA